MVSFLVDGYGNALNCSKRHRAFGRVREGDNRDCCFQRSSIESDTDETISQRPVLPAAACWLAVTVTKRLRRRRRALLADTTERNYTELDCSCASQLVLRLLLRMPPMAKWWRSYRLHSTL